jgi:hypothetical protein
MAGRVREALAVFEATRAGRIFRLSNTTRGKIMAPMTRDILLQLLVPFLLMFFFVGGLFGLAVGLGLILFSKRMFRISGWWYSSRHTSKRGDAMHLSLDK